VADGRLVTKGEKVDLYLEGADQHRGWFHSSLLAARGRAGSAPYKAVLTHGWVLDERGKVYSKSEIEKGARRSVKTDYVEPGAWMEKNAREVLRLWAPRPTTSRRWFSKTIMDQLGRGVSQDSANNLPHRSLSTVTTLMPSRRSLCPTKVCGDLDRLRPGMPRRNATAGVRSPSWHSHEVSDGWWTSGHGIAESWIR